MKKIKIMAICTSLIIAFSSLNAEEKKPYVNGTIVTFDSFINSKILFFINCHPMVQRSMTVTNINCL